MTLRILVQTILACLAAMPAGAYTVEMKTVFVKDISWGGSSGGQSTAPVPFVSGQSVLAAIWNQDEWAVAVRVSAVDAMTGETLGAAEAQAAPGVVTLMALPLKAPSMRHVAFTMFKADGTPLRAQIHASVHVFDGPVTAEELAAPWGRVFDLEATSTPVSVRTEPLVVTDAHDLTLQLFNHGGRAAVTVRGWDPMTKKELIGKTEIVESSRGARFEIPSSIARQLSPIVAGGAANGMIQLEVVVEPLDGVADISLTAEAPVGDVSYPQVTFKRGVFY